VEKPAECVSCGSLLSQPATGRPRVYCSVPCRRAAEYELRRVQSLLLTAERREQQARAAHELEIYDRASTRRHLKFWTAEVARLKDQQRTLLSGVRDDDSPQEAPES
jgi:hypothetical protein